MADTWTGDNAYLRMNASVGPQNNGENWVDIYWELLFGERSAGSFGWSGGGIPASVSISGDGINETLWSGTFGFDFRPGGTQEVSIARGTKRVYNYGDGNARGVTFRGTNGNTGTSTGGSGASANQFIAPPDTKVRPGTVTNGTATYVNDSNIQLNWQNNGAANGQPTNNQIYVSEDGQAWRLIANIQASNSALWGAAQANRQYWFLIIASNSAGTSDNATTNIVYTTPAAPTSVTAAKQTNQDIAISWVKGAGPWPVNNEITHGVVASNGSITWDSSPMVTVGDVLSYTHVSPNPSQIHIYSVRSIVDGRGSSYTASNSVQLLVAPNKPTLPGLPANADRAQALSVAWVHNSQDTTAQTAYEFQTSINGGSSWSTTGKVTGTANNRTIAANTYAANTTLQIRVRTWGQATAGGSDGTGASPYSDISSITFKSAPTAAITAPANGSSLSDSTVRVTMSFAQAQSATFVKGQYELRQGSATGTLVESFESTNRVGVPFTVKVQNGVSYTVRARALDSNGLWSAWATSSFTVSFLSPVPANSTVVYLPETGFAQINMLIPAPTGQQSAAVKVSITRTINGVVEAVLTDYPVASDMSVLDSTPTINGTNVYTIITTSAQGSTSTVVKTLVTTECRRAFLSKGPGFGVVGVFGGNLSIDESLSVASGAFQAAGRVKPIGLYGTETNVQMKVSSLVFEGFGSTVDQLRDVLLMTGKACYRDSSGRRVFGVVKGSVSRTKVTRGELSFTLTETS